MLCVIVWAEKEVPTTIKWQKTESVFDKRLDMANARPSMQLAGRGALSVIPDYAQTDQTRRMWLLSGSLVAASDREGQKMRLLTAVSKFQ